VSGQSGPMIGDSVIAAKAKRRAPALYMILVLFLLASTNLRAQGERLQIAAAADLKFAMAELASQFESSTRIRVGITTGASGNFFAQIQSGAPFDLFFSADMTYPQKLAAAGFAEPGTLSAYALGRIVIWAPASTPLDVTKQGWSALLDSRVEKIAVANPVPHCGRRGSTNR
jgi:molybdate transport system substrate-binding protein